MENELLAFEVLYLKAQLAEPGRSAAQLEDQLRQAKEQLAQVEQSRVALQARAAELQARVASLQVRVANLQAQLAEARDRSPVRRLFQRIRM